MTSPHNPVPGERDPYGDVVKAIRLQHETIRELSRQVSEAPPAGRRHAFEPLVRLLAVHETAEEMVVYPIIRAYGDDGRAIADVQTGEEGHAKKALAALEGLDASSAEFEAAFASFRDEIETHVRHEEANVLPFLERMDADGRARMARSFNAAELLAPTHGHRRGPTTATGNMILGPFIAIVDRVRDVIRDLERHAR